MQTPTWPMGQSETAELIRKKDWSQTSLGPISDWPSSLKVSVQLCLDSKIPMYLWWGPDYINPYNDAYIALAGPAKHALYFGKPAQMMWPEVWPTLQDFLTEVKTKGTSIFHEDLQMPLERHGKPEEAYFCFSYGPARDENGEIRGIHCTCYETTSKIKAKRQTDIALQSAQRAIAIRDEFLSMASHELKTPLTSMKLQTQSVLRGIARGHADSFSPEKVARLAENTAVQVSRLNHLVEDMLDISRIQSGKQSIHLDLMSLSDVVINMYEQFREQFAMAGCEATIEVVPGVEGNYDRFKIEQVLTNLLSNAIRYGAGKPISVKLMVEDERAILKVTDQGIGIEAANFEKVFGRFERILSPKRINGLGLGLYITKQIVLAHNGEIRIESELGKGSTFIVELPYEKSKITHKSSASP